MAAITCSLQRNFNLTGNLWIACLANGPASPLGEIARPLSFDKGTFENGYVADSTSGKLSAHQGNDIPPGKKGVRAIRG